MTTAMQNQKAAVHSGQWVLYRYNPERAKGGENPLQLDSQTIPVIASFNGSTASGWTSFAKQIQQAGADALELNLYNIPTDQHSHRQFGAWDLELFNPPLLA